MIGNRKVIQMGMVLTPLRLVVGWLFFSALWRRAVLDPSKLDISVPGSLATKTNHFLPHAIDPGGLLELTLRTPEILEPVLWAVTLAEGVAGLGLLLGIATRLSALLVTVLSGAILLSAGWLGTTCLDEWQIGVLGVSGGAVIALAGGGPYGLDTRLGARFQRGPLGLLCSGALPERWLRPLVVGGSLSVMLLTLATNQYFHGGLVGPLHNLSAKPHVAIERAELHGEQLEIELMRDEGPDTHGAFVVGLQLLDGQGKVLEDLPGAHLSGLASESIQNTYIARVHTGPYGLVLPLGAKATIRLPVSDRAAGAERLRLLEVSGLQWEANLLHACSFSGAMQC